MNCSGTGESYSMNRLKIQRLKEDPLIIHYSEDEISCIINKYRGEQIKASDGGNVRPPISTIEQYMEDYCLLVGNGVTDERLVVRNLTIDTPFPEDIPSAYYGDLKSLRSGRCKANNCKYCKLRQKEAWVGKTVSQAFMSNDVNENESIDSNTEEDKLYPRYYLQGKFHSRYVAEDYDETRYFHHSKKGGALQTTAKGAIAVVDPEMATSMLDSIKKLRQEQNLPHHRGYRYQSRNSTELATDLNLSGIDAADDDDEEESHSLDINKSLDLSSDDTLNNKNNTTQETADLTNYDSDGDDEDPVDHKALQPLHNIKSGSDKETEDSFDIAVSELYMINTDNTCHGPTTIVLEERTESAFPNRPLVLETFSHRFEESTGEDKARILLLVQDGTNWLVENLYPHLKKVLSFPTDADTDQKQLLWFINTYVVVTPMINRIIKSHPWAFINPLDLLKKSKMDPEALRIVFYIKSLLDYRAIKNRLVSKQVIDRDWKFSVDSKTNMEEPPTTMLKQTMVLPAASISVSMCTGATTSKMIQDNSRVVPGMGEEIQIADDSTFVDPYIGMVYSNLEIPYRNQKMGYVHERKPSPYFGKDGRLERYEHQLKVNHMNEGRTFGISRIVQAAVHPLAAPFTTMDHLDGHQFNGMHNLDNCQKTENLLRIGKAFITNPTMAPGPQSKSKS